MSGHSGRLLRQGDIEADLKDDESTMYRQRRTPAKDCKLERTWLIRGTEGKLVKLEYHEWQGWERQEWRWEVGRA